MKKGLEVNKCSYNRYNEGKTFVVGVCLRKGKFKCPKGNEPVHPLKRFRLSHDTRCFESPEKPHTYRRIPQEGSNHVHVSSIPNAQGYRRPFRSFHPSLLRLVNKDARGQLIFSLPRSRSITIEFERPSSNVCVPLQNSTRIIILG